jgi:hypothetical protein
MPRFVILRHELPSGGPRGSHWDLMFERNEVLRTWALEQLPDESQPSVAHELADHRLEYLDYEGPVSAGRGSVARWDEGQYVLEAEAEDRLVITIEGRHLAGQLTLARAAEDRQLWRVSFSAAPTSG